MERCGAADELRPRRMDRKPIESCRVHLFVMKILFHFLVRIRPKEEICFHRTGKEGRPPCLKKPRLRLGHLSSQKRLFTATEGVYDGLFVRKVMVVGFLQREGTLQNLLYYSARLKKLIVGRASCSWNMPSQNVELLVDKLAIK